MKVCLGGKMLLVVTTGLIAGALHVLAGPDHLAAIAPIAIKSRAKGASVGASWGWGHGLGVCCLSGIGMLFRDQINIDLISGWSEVLVGFLLIGIGAWSIQQAMKIVIHTHEHHHDGDNEHEHHHLHLSSAHAEQDHSKHSHSALGVGFLHGMAGTGHLLGVLPALALPTESAVVYVLAYLCSAVLSMSLVGGLLGLVLQQGKELLFRNMMMGSGTSAIVIGIYWIGAGH